MRRQKKIHSSGKARRLEFRVWGVQGRSLTRKRAPLGPYQENAPPWDPTLCPGSWGGPRGVGVLLSARYPCRNQGCGKAAAVVE